MSIIVYFGIGLVSGGLAVGAIELGEYLKRRDARLRYDAARYKATKEKAD